MNISAANPLVCNCLNSLSMHTYSEANLNKFNRIKFKVDMCRFTKAKILLNLMGLLSRYA